MQFILSIVSIVQGPCSIVMRSLVVVPKIPIQVRGDWWFSLAHLRTPGICRSPTCLKVMRACNASAHVHGTNHAAVLFNTDY